MILYSGSSPTELSVHLARHYSVFSQHSRKVQSFLIYWFVKCGAFVMVLRFIVKCKETELRVTGMRKVFPVVSTVKVSNCNILFNMCLC